MTQNPTYPEPDAASNAMHPYGHDYPMPAVTHPFHQHPVEASIRRESDGTGGSLQGNSHIPVQGHVSTPQQLAQRSLDVNQGPNKDAQESSSRKRSKVSRACDECRRKKIRCDAESEAPGTTCTSCRRAGLQCDFSRAPQKRGPSKGYIKELAERVNFLEYKTGAAPVELQYNALVPEHPGPYIPPGEPNIRKRAYDSFSGSSSYDNTYNTLQDFTPRQPVPHTEPPIRGESSTEPLQHTGDPIFQPSKMNATAEHENLINAYYELIHPFLPLLPDQTDVIQQYVQVVPVALCNAFFAALEAAITACTNSDSSAATKIASAQLDAVQGDADYTATMPSKLVDLQALILMVVATENSGPSHNHKNRWISLAVDAATHMDLHYPRSPDSHDHDSYIRGGLGRRAWLILFVLDRWHALSTCDILRVPEVNIKLMDHDRTLIGEATYHLWRLSRTLGHLYEGFTSRDDESTKLPSRGGIISAIIDAAIESFRESTYQEWPRMPYIHMAYLHARLLTDRYLEVYASKTGSIVHGCLQIVTLLRHKKGLFCTPWAHHVTGLTAATLGELADRQIHSDAPVALRDLRDGLDTALFRTHAGKTAWDLALSAFITKKLEGGAQGPFPEGASDRGGLRELADAAVGNTETSAKSGDANTPHGSPDWAAGISNGYLNLF